MNSRIRQTLVGFHYRVERHLEGMQNKRDMVGLWECLPLDEVIEAVGIEEVDTYILRRQNPITKYIVTHLILELFMAAERWPGARVTWSWREQGGLYLYPGGRE